MQIKILFAALVLVPLMTGVASARCVSLPDGPQSRNVENGERHMICLNNELTDTSREIALNAKLSSFSTQIRQIELQNRFENLPTTTQF